MKKSILIMDAIVKFVTMRNLPKMVLKLTCEPIIDALYAKRKMGKLNFRIPEICDRPCSKHDDISHCVVSYPFKLTCVKRNTKAAYSKRWSIPIQEVTALSSGKAVLSLLRSNKSESLELNSSTRSIVPTEKTVTSPSIKRKSSSVHYRSASSKIPYAKHKISRHLKRRPPIRDHPTDNRMEPMMPNSSFKDIQSQIPDLVNNVYSSPPFNSVVLPFNVSIKNFISKFLFLQSHFSFLPTFHSNAVTYSSTEVLRMLKLENPPHNDERKSSRNLILCAFNSFSTLWCLLQCTKPLSICLFGQAWEFSFILRTVNSHVKKFDVVIIPILNISSRITNFQIVMKRCFSSLSKKQHLRLSNTKQGPTLLLSNKKYKQHLSLRSNSFIFKAENEGKKKRWRVLIRQKCLECRHNSQGKTFNFLSLPEPVFEHKVESSHSLKNNFSVFQPLFWSAIRHGDDILQRDSGSSRSFCSTDNFGGVQDSKTFPYTTAALMHHVERINYPAFRANTLFSFRDILAHCGKSFSNFKIASPDAKLHPVFKIRRNSLSICRKRRANFCCCGSQKSSHWSNKLTEIGRNDAKEYKVANKKFDGNVRFHSTRCTNASRWHIFDLSNTFIDLKEVHPSNDGELSLIEDMVENTELTNFHALSEKADNSHTSLTDLKRKCSVSVCDYNKVGQKPPYFGSEAVEKEVFNVNDKIETNPNELLKFQTAAFNTIRNALPSIEKQVNICETASETRRSFSEDSDSFNKHSVSLTSKSISSQMRRVEGAAIMISVQSSIVEVSETDGLKNALTDVTTMAVGNSFSDLATNEAAEPDTSRFVNPESCQNTVLSFKDQNRNGQLPKKMNEALVENDVNEVLFVRFQTASGRKIQVSEKALNTVKNKFSTLVSDKVVESEVSSTLHPENFHTLSNLNSRNDLREKCLSENTGSVLVENAICDAPLVDFQTTTKEKMQISEKTSAKDKSCPKSPERTIQISPNSMPLQTVLSPSCSEYHPSESCQLSTKTVSTIKNNYDKSLFLCFQTAAGKRIEVSEETLSAVKRKFSNNFSDGTEEIQTLFPVNAESQYKNVDTSKSNFKYRQTCSGRLSNETDAVSFENDSSGEVPFLGFQTAAGKAIEVSEKALNTVKNKFTEFMSYEEIESGKLSPINCKPVQEYLSDLNYKPDLKEKVLEKSDSIPIEKKDSISFIGFQTAAGKRIPISNKALKHVRDKFSDFAPSKIEENQMVNSKDFKQPQTNFSGTELIFQDQQNDKDLLLNNTLAISVKNNLNQMPSSSFQAASGKTVEVSEEALNTAKNMFCDVIPTDTAESEMISVDSESHKEDSWNSSFVHVVKDKDQLLGKSISVSIENLPKKVPYIGFQTAAGKRICVSEKSLNTLKKKFSNISANNVIGIQSPSFRGPKNFPNSNWAQHSNEKSTLPDQDDVTSISKRLNDIPFVGFQAASGKHIQISEKAMNAVKSKFSDFMPDSVTEIDKASTKSSLPQEMLYGSKPRFEEQDLENCSQLSGKTESASIEKCPIQIPVVGFQTTSGKVIKISEAALNMTKNKFSDLISNETLESENLISTDYQSLEKDLLEGQFLGVDNATTSTEKTLDDLSVVGFCTASGKDIPISKKALNTVKAKLSNPVDCNMNEIQSLPREKHRPPPKYFCDSELNSKCKQDSSSLTSNNRAALMNKLESLPCIGFQTVAGKNENVSVETLSSVEKKLHDSVSDEMTEFHPECLSSFVDIRERDKLPKKSSSMFVETHLNKVPYVGFQTAAGKSVSISEEALTAVKNKFTDFASSVVVGNQTLPQKESGYIPKDLLSSRSSFGSKPYIERFPKNIIISVADNKNQMFPFPGFQTASGKTIKVSEKALNAIKDKFSDMVSDEKTESGVSVNSESLERPPLNSTSVNIKEKDQLCSETNSVDTEKVTLVDFQTDTEKKGCNSEQALRTVRNVFSDLILDQEIANEMTFTNTETLHRESGLSCSDPNAREEDQLLINFEKNLGKDSFGGFQTAAGRKVEVSEESISAAKRKYSSLMNGEEMGFQTLNAGLPTLLNSGSHSENVVEQRESLLQLSHSPSAGNGFLQVGQFQAAYGRNISVSEKTLNIVKEKFSNDFGNAPTLKNRTSVTPNSKNSLLVNSGHISTEKPSFVGFRTASGKNVNISEESLDLVNRKFSSLIHNEVEEEENEIASTDHKQGLYDSCDAMSDLKSNINVNSELRRTTDSFPIKNTSGSNCFAGFHTAAGKDVTVSEKALNYVKNKLSDFSNDANSSDEKASLIDLGSSRTRLRHSDNNPENNYKAQPFTVTTSHSQLKTSASEFQTAAGKKVPNSKDALSVTKRKLGEFLHVEAPQSIASNPFKIPRISSDCQSEFDSKTKHFHSENSTLFENVPSGLQMASGTNIEISKRASNSVNENNFDILDSETEANDVDLEFFEKFQNMDPLLKVSPNNPILFEETTALCFDGNIINNTSLQRSNGVSELTFAAVEEKLSSTQSFKTRNLKPGSEISNGSEAEIWKKGKIQFVDFDICMCHKTDFQAKKAADSTLSLNSSKRGFVTECSFICPCCSKPCELATVHTLPKKPDFHNLLHNSRNEKMNRKIYSVNIRKMEYQSSKHISSARIRLESLPRTVRTNTANSNAVDIVRCGTSIAEVEKQRQQQTHRIACKGKVNAIAGKLATLKRNAHFHKQMSLRQLTNAFSPGMYTVDQLLAFGMKQRTSEVSSSTAGNFFFKEQDFSGCTFINPYCFTVGDNVSVILDNSKCARKKEFFSAFLDSPGVDPSLISEAWFYNHYRWIVWKLASFEFSFPLVFAGNCLTPQNVMLQMKLRYDYEVDNAKRSALKKIVERDDTPSKTLVLFISSISRCKSGKPENEEINENVYEVKLSDGWYEISAKIDTAMINLISLDRVKIGHKIITSGAELCGSDVACSPLEIPNGLQLKIHTNSTRVARWDVKLGYFPDSRPFPVPVSSVIADGGCIGHICVVISRVYPILYMEKYENGPRITRSEKMEFKIRAQHQKLQEYHLNQIMKSVLKTFEERSEKKKIIPGRKLFSCRDKLLTGKELSDAFNSAADIPAFMELLDEHQVYMLKEFEKRRVEEERFQVEKEINNAIVEAKNAGEYPIDRDVAPVLRVLVKGCHKLDQKFNKDVMLNIWRPSSDVLDLFTEGTAMGIYYLIPNKHQSDVINLNTIKTTRYERMTLEKTTMENLFQPRKVTPLVDIAKQFHNSAVIDIVGFIFHVTQSSENFTRSTDLIYVADVDFNSLVIKFPDGLSSTGCQDFLTTRNVTAVCNLKLEVNEFSFIGTATLVTTFLSNPKATYLSEAVKSLKEQIRDPVQFIQKAKLALENKLERQRRKSKHHYNNVASDSPYENSVKRQKTETIPSKIFNNQRWNSIEQITNEKSPSLSKCQYKKLFPSVEDRLLKLETLPQPPSLPKLPFSTSFSVRSSFKSPK